MTATMTPPAGPELTPAATGEAHAVERPVIGELRDHLQSGGIYEADYGLAGNDEAFNAVFQLQLERTTEWLKDHYGANSGDTISAREAVNVLLSDFAGPYLAKHTADNMDARLAASGIDNPDDASDEDEAAATAAIRADFEQSLINAMIPEGADRAEHDNAIVTPEDDEDEPTTERTSWFTRIKESGTLAQTRKAFRHWRNMRKAVKNASDDEMEEALSNRKEARNHLTLTVAGTIGALAATSFVIGNTYENGMNTSEWISPGSVAKATLFGVVATGAAVAYEGIKEGYRNGRAHTNHKLMRAANALFGNWKEDKLYRGQLEEADPDAYNRLQELDARDTRGNELLASLREAAGDDFDEENENYQNALEEVNANREERDEFYDELLEEFGERKWTRWGLIRMAIGSAAVVGVSGYLLKNGLPFRSGNSQQAASSTQPSGNGNGSQAGQQAAGAAPNGSTGGAGSQAANQAGQAAGNNPNGGGNGGNSVTMDTIYQYIKSQPGNGNKSDAEIQKLAKDTFQIAWDRDHWPPGQALYIKPISNLIYDAGFKHMVDSGASF